MDTEQNKQICYAFFERAFGQGDLTAVDEFQATDGIDHQEPLGTDFIQHLKDVVIGMRTAFPDLHFEIHNMLAEGDIVAIRSTMTGTHSGSLGLLPGRQIPATGRKISVPHMHFLRIVNGKTRELWHMWNTQLMLKQLGIMPEQPAH